MSAETQGSLPEGWTHVRFGDVVRNKNLTTKDPEKDGLDRIVGLTHLDSESLSIVRWDSLEGETSFSRAFAAGDVLFGKRRAYQRKVGVPDFAGICSGDILVFESKDSLLLQEFLPYIVQSDAFFERAVGTSAGSLSPRTNWTQLARFEFALPPIEEQKRIVEVLSEMDTAIEANRIAATAAEVSRQSAIDHFLSLRHSGVEQTDLGSICDFQTGPAFKSGVFRSTTDGPVIVRGANIGPDGLRWDETFRWPKDDVGAYSDFLLESGDVCLAMDATFAADGRMRKGVITAPDLPALVNQRVARLRPTPTCPTEFIEAVLDSRAAVLHLTNKQTGAFAPHVSGGDIRSVPVALAPGPERERFLALLRNFDALVVGLAARLRSLLSLRMSLREALLGGADVF